MRTAMMSVGPIEFALAAAVWLGVLAFASSGAEPAPAGPDEGAAGEPPPAEAADPDGQQALQADFQRQAMWNSPAMQAARAWLAEYFRTSSQSSPEVERAYMQRLSQLSAAEMQTWLRDFIQQRQRTAAESHRFAEIRRQKVAAAAASARRGPVIRRPTSSGYSYVQPVTPQRPFSEQQYLLRDAPLRSFEIVHYLDTLQIRDELFDLRARGR